MINSEQSKWRQETTLQNQQLTYIPCLTLCTKLEGMKSLKNFVECQKIEDWYTIRNSDHIHKKEDKEHMYFSDPLFEIVEATNNVMDNSWRMIKKAGNLLSDITGNSV